MQIVEDPASEQFGWATDRNPVLIILYNSNAKSPKSTCIQVKTEDCASTFFPDKKCS